MRLPLPLPCEVSVFLACIGLYCSFPRSAPAANTPEYSKESVVVQSFARQVAFAADGTWRSEQSAVIRVQSEAGVREFGVLAFPYNSDNQSVEIEYIRVKKPEGDVVNTPAENVQDVSSEVTRVAPTFSDLREKQIPVKALSTGDVLEYKIRITQTKPEAPGQFWYTQNFLTNIVVLQETLRISTPVGKYVKVASPTIRPEIREESGEKIYSWSTAQLRPTTKSDDAKQAEKKAAAGPTAPSVQVTTFQSWDEVGRWYRHLQQDRLTTTPAIQAKAAELTKGLTNNVEKQKAIYRYVSTKFRYISVSLGAGRYQPHSAAEVLANQYGDCKDKHTLFAALLRAAGIEAWPALIGVGIKLDSDVPSPAQFNHLITVIPNEKDYVWLDTTPEVAPYGLLTQSVRDEKALVIPRDGPAILMTTPADPPFPASETIDVNAKLSDDGTLKAHFDITLHGDTELGLRSAFHSVSPAQWQELQQTLMRSLGFAGTVSSVDVDNPENLDKPLHYSFDYVRENYSDWPNRRITPPLIPITLPSSENDEKPLEPIVMGPPGETTYRATIQLPKDFSAEIPEGVKVNENFAVYTSSYTLTNGVLSAKRQLIAKKSKIVASDWDEYVKFRKTLVSDQTQFIQLAASTGSQKTVTVVRNNPDAAALIGRAVQSMQNGDMNAARDALLQAERLNPQQPYLYGAYATLYFAQNDEQRGLEALSKEIQNHPDSVPAYRALAQAEVHYGHRDQAIETLNKLLKISPDEAETGYTLSSLLIAEKRYKEVPHVLEKPLAKSPDNPQLQFALAEALLRDGRKDEGVVIARKLLKDASDGNTLNNGAWILADTGTSLQLAKEYAEKSVSITESELKDVSLSTVSSADLGRVSLLGAAWDTLGWAYFRLGETQKAESYLTASWRLMQDGVVADHLGQVYQQQGKERAAIHMWQLALAANNQMEETRERLRKLGVSATPVLQAPRKGTSTVPLLNANVAPGEELGKLRTTAITDLPKQEGSAEFFVLFSSSKVEDVQFISGAEQLKSASAALAKVHYDAPFPDDGPEKIPRRGVLSCSNYTTPSCQFVMLLPTTTTAGR